jgi:hypothetical protein
MDQPPLLVYVDGRTLRGIAGCHDKKGVMPGDGEALHRIWRLFKEERIRLVTSRKETETDIILWLNGQGCCVTDTLVIPEAVEEFARWEGADKKAIEGHRRLTRLFEEIDGLPSAHGETECLLAFISREIHGITEKDHPALKEMEQKKEVLRQCAECLRQWYSDDGWKNLRKTDYGLNWRLLTSVLGQQEKETGQAIDEPGRDLVLFGLLNRVVGLIKKSCPALPAKEEHIGFVIDMVMKKYDVSHDERAALHLLLCIHHGIPFFLTTDHDMARRFNERREALRAHPDLRHALPDLVVPKDLEGRTLPRSQD